MTTEMPYSGETVLKSTGKSWEEWRTLLDDWGASNKDHTEIVEHIIQISGLNGWWAQGITIGYERAIGRRAVGQRGDGSWSASASKTIPVVAETVHAALTNDDRRRRWLNEGVVTLRTSTSAKSVRFDDLEAGVIIAFFLTPNGDSKTSLQVQGEKFATAEASDAWKSAWKQRLIDLAAYLQK